MILSQVLPAAVPMAVPAANAAEPDPFLEAKAACVAQTQLADDDYEIPPDCELINKFGEACLIRCPDGVFLILCTVEPWS